MSIASVVVPVEKGALLERMGQIRNLLDGAIALPLVKEIFVVGDIEYSDRMAFPQKGIRVISAVGGRGIAIQAALSEIKSDLVIIQDPDPAYSSLDYSRLIEPLITQDADAVYGVRQVQQKNGRVGFFDSLTAKWASSMCNALTRLSLLDWETGLKAFRVEILKKLSLRSVHEGIDAEIVVKLASRMLRIHQVPISFSGERNRVRIGSHLQKTGTVLRNAIHPNSGEPSGRGSIHPNNGDLSEGYTTLLRMEEGAPRYNAWLGQKLSGFLGNRVLEVGAGIGTITKHLAPDRELVVALEVEQFYYERLKSLFANCPQVVPLLAGVEEADWQQLKEHRFDSIVLSNVLEHIADDYNALLNFRGILPRGGRLVILVPAEPMLFGSLDQAVGHFRRYTKRGLGELLEGSGFVVERLESMNVLGMPGWFVNGRIFKRRAMPTLQLRAYDLLAPFVARVENRFQPRLGMSVLAVAKSAG